MLHIAADAAGEVFPLASKRSEFLVRKCALLYVQVWDDELERSATHWAEQCHWDHGPEDLLVSIGQNLAVHWGR